MDHAFVAGGLGPMKDAVVDLPLGVREKPAAALAVLHALPVSRHAVHGNHDANRFLFPQYPFR
jgi:hypothetical protein